MTINLARWWAAEEGNVYEDRGPGFLSAEQWNKVNSEIELVLLVASEGTAAAEAYSSTRALQLGAEHSYTDGALRLNLYGPWRPDLDQTEFRKW